MAYQARLESACRQIDDRGFESHPLRHLTFFCVTVPIVDNQRYNTTSEKAQNKSRRG